MKKLFRNLLILLLVLSVGGGLFLYVAGKQAAANLEQGQSLESKVQEVISRPDYVPYDQLPSFLVDATISIEDRRFYDHEGVDVIGLLRAGLSWFVPDMVRSGGSTISQQVVKNLYGRFDTDLERKLAEIWLSEKLNEMLSKDEIFALYVNIINYGDGYTGIREAAAGYFGVEPMWLTEGQCAILAGIPNSPGNLQLSDHYEQARSRELLVLQAMTEAGYISKEKAEAVYDSGT